ncbi:MAG TPA: hypothetical protein VEW26_15190 [Allosphingosinicella sp.]|nr:hypothetical protein [Allosphingosinicella sp.]
MHPIVFLALLTIAMLLLAALRLELNFRRTAEAGPGPETRGSRPEREPRRPELRASPAGGYCQSPWSAGAPRRG